MDVRLWSIREVAAKSGNSWALERQGWLVGAETTVSDCLRCTKSQAQRWR